MAGFLVKKGVLLFTFFIVALAAVTYFAKTTSTAFITSREDKGILLVNVQLFQMRHPCLVLKGYNKQLLRWLSGNRVLMV
ncbi:hypothetical protein OH492_10360 [Vibrio chagasii]|nr:hypothetical protein [Vibrio chagasii]